MIILKEIQEYSWRPGWHHVRFKIASLSTTLALKITLIFLKHLLALDATVTVALVEL